MLLFYIRHGQPTYTPDSLTPLGERQAEAVGKRLALYGIDKIFSSPLKRAEKTALPSSEILGKEIVTLDFASESLASSEFWATEKKSGKRGWCFSLPEFREHFAAPVTAYDPKWYEKPLFSDQKFGEGVKRIDKASDEWLLSLGYRHLRDKGCYKEEKTNNDRIALFAHQGFGLIFLSSILDIPYPAFCTHFDIGHSDITVINFEADDGMVIPRVLSLSNDGHLYKEGLPTRYNNSNIVF